jgi:hypothetical protein
MPIFLFSGFLFFGLAALVPLALHLLHRRRPQPYLFAAMRFIEVATAASRRSRRITQGLTLLMRVLIILTLAAAFAQPLLRSSSKLLSDGQRVLIVVLDCSASMQASGGDKSLFELAQAWAATLIDGLAEGDRVAIIAAGYDEPRIVLPPLSDQHAVKRALLELRATAGQAELVETLRELLQRQSGGLKHADLHIFSDFQHASWNPDALPPLLERLEEEAAAFFLNQLRCAAGGDSGIGRVSFVPPAILDDGLVSAVAQIGSNEHFVGSDILRLQGPAGEELNHVALELLPKDSHETRLQGMCSGDAPDWTGVLSLNDDVFALNNRYYFSLPRLSGAPALLVNGGGDSDTFFLERALRPSGQAAALMLAQILDWSGFMASDISAYAAVFICNPPLLDAAVLQKLDGYLLDGGVVMLFPGEEGGLNEENLRAFAPWERLQVGAVDLGELRRLDIAAANGQDSILQKLPAILPPPWSVPLRRYLSLQPARAEQSILNEQNGAAFLLRARHGTGWLWLCATTANRDWSDWPMTPLFFILMQEICKEAVALRQPRLAAEVGGAVAIPWPGQSKQGEFRISAPDGSERRLQVQRQQHTEPFVLSGFSQPGIHTVEYGGMTRKLAVNIPAPEGDLTYWRSSELLAAVRPLPAAHCFSHEQLQENISRLRQGSPLWPSLLLLAFGLSMIEVLFANIRSRPQKQPQFLSKVLKQGTAIS